MACEHKRIKSVNCEKFCIDCGEKLPADYNPSVKGENQANNQPAEEKKSKSPARKKAAKTAEKGA